MGSGRCLQSYISLQVMGITHGCRFHCLVFQTPKLRPSFILFKYTIHIYKCHLISYYFYQYFTNIQWLHIFSPMYQCMFYKCFISSWPKWPVGNIFAEMQERIFFSLSYLGQFFFFFTTAKKHQVSEYSQTKDYWQPIGGGLAFR